MKSVKKPSRMTAFKGLAFSMTEESMRINNEQTGRHDGEINYVFWKPRDAVEEKQTKDTQSHVCIRGQGQL